MSIVSKRNLALMRNNEMHEMGVANIGCDKLTKCLPELDSGAFQTFGIEIWERHRLKAGVTGRERHRLGGRCDVQERQCVKLMSIVGKRNMALMRNNEMHEMDVDCSMRQTHEMSP